MKADTRGSLLDCHPSHAWPLSKSGERTLSSSLPDFKSAQDLDTSLSLDAAE